MCRLKSSSSLLQVRLTVVPYAALNPWPPTAWCIISFISRCEHPVYPFCTSHIYLPELHPILCDCSLVYTVHFSIVVWQAATKNGKSPIWFWFEVHIWLTVWSWVGLWLCDSFLEFFNIDEKNLISFYFACLFFFICRQVGLIYWIRIKIKCSLMEVLKWTGFSHLSPNTRYLLLYIILQEYFQLQ